MFVDFLDNGEPQMWMINEKLKKCVKTLKTSQIEISTNMEGFLNPPKLVPEKINESTESEVAIEV